MYGTIQVRLNASDPVMAYLVHQCKQSNSLINSTLFEVRKSHFGDCPRVEFFDANGFYRSEFKTRTVTAPYAQLCTVMKDNLHYKALGGQCAQQTLKSVSESFAGFNKLLQLFFKGETNKPRMPGYRTKGGLAPIVFPAQALQFDIETGECRIPISQENAASVKEHFGLSELRINGAFGVKHHQIVELRIIPRNNEFYAEYVYRHGNDGATCHLDLDRNHALGIDPGLSNWLTCVSTRGKSFIVDGRKLKSINQNYNRRVASLKTGKKNNQEFVQIPTSRLKNRIKQLCEEKGIQFNQTEESYTSKTSFLDNDFLPTYGEKPASWKPSGKRGKKGDGIGRGQYRTAQGILINSDCNAAVNILRKVSAQLGIILTESVRAVLTLPKRYELFNGLRKSYRKRCEASIRERVATSA